MIGFRLDDRAEVAARDAEVVRAIEEEGLSLFSFDGLRRITGSHPETLSRSLERLEDSGIVARSPDGYSLTQKGRDFLQVRPAADLGDRVSILQTYLPHGYSARIIVEALKGRWFDTARWVGMSESEEGVVMKWVTDDGGAVVDARLGGGQLMVEARLKSDADLPKAVRAAHQLMGRISRLYSSPRPGARNMYLHLAYFRPSAM